MMDGFITAGIFKLMGLLYESVDGATANRGLCDSLAMRVKVIEGAIMALETTPLRQAYALAAPLTQLQTTLQSAIMLVKEQSTKSKVLLFLSGSTVRSRFDEIHRRLSQCQIDMSIPFEADTRDALACIMHQQQESAAQMEILAESIAASLPPHVASAIREGFARRRAVAAMPAPGGGPFRMISGGRGNGRAEADAVAAAAAAVTQAEASRPAWLLDYDALHFELDKRGRRRELGRGASAVVYKALYYGQPVAVKVISGGVHDPAHRAVFDKELETCFALRHPNIAVVLGGTAPMYSSFSTGGRPVTNASMSMDEDEGAEFAIIMEQETTCLATLMKASADEAAAGDTHRRQTHHHNIRPLTDMDRVRILRGVASALVYLHVARPKIVHCDLKPANVLIGADGSAKLTDFGVAATRGTVINPRAAGDAAAAQSAGGWTEAYAAPEVLRDPGTPPDERADVYSFGVLMLELFTGRPAWPAGTSVRQRILDGASVDVPSDGSLPAPVAAIVRACVRGSAADRPFAADLVAALASPVGDLVAADPDGFESALGTRLPAVILRAPIADPSLSFAGAPSNFAASGGDGPASGAGSASEKASVRARLVRYYAKYAPDKGDSAIDAVLRMYDGRYPDMFERLVTKYGPEPAATPITPTTPSKTPNQAPFRASAQSKHQGLRDRLTRFYVQHDASKLGNVDEIITRFHDVEGDLFARLVAKYGPEPPADRAEQQHPHHHHQQQHPTTAATAVVTKPSVDEHSATELPGTVARHGTPAAGPAVEGGGAKPGSGDGAASPLPGAPPAKDHAKFARELVRTIPDEARVQLLQFYEHHAPDKVSSVDKVLTRFAGREDELFATLAILYGCGPELVPAESGL